MSASASKIFEGLTIAIDPHVYNGVRERQDELVALLLDIGAALGPGHAIAPDSPVNIVLVDASQSTALPLSLPSHVDPVDYTWVDLCLRFGRLVDRSPFRPVAGHEPAMMTGGLFHDGLYYFLHSVPKYSDILRQLKDAGARICMAPDKADIVLVEYSDAYTAQGSAWHAAVVDVSWVDMCIRTGRRVPQAVFKIDYRPPSMAMEEEHVDYERDVDTLGEGEEHVEVDCAMNIDTLGEGEEPRDPAPVAAREVRTDSPSPSLCGPVALPIPPATLRARLKKRRHLKRGVWADDLEEYLVSYYKAAWRLDPNRSARDIAESVAELIPEISEGAVRLWTSKPAARLAGVKKPGRIETGALDQSSHSATASLGVASTPGTSSREPAQPAENAGIRLELPPPRLADGDYRLVRGAARHAEEVGSYFKAILEWEYVRNPNTAMASINADLVNSKPGQFSERAFVSYWRTPRRQKLFETITRRAAEMRSKGYTTQGDWRIVAKTSDDSTSTTQQLTSSDLHARDDSRVDVNSLPSLDAVTSMHEDDMLEEEDEDMDRDSPDDDGVSVRSTYPDALSDEQAAAVAEYMDWLDDDKLGHRSRKPRVVWRWFSLKYPEIASSLTPEQWEVAYNLQKTRTTHCDRA
ncbi:hypothetical protein EXIGLDRAFT_828563 [Exidia glandulosa HHB12029]|uniref:BRCT domain-containing protein n=1 Tax=Exidia glandulosa HHB12029 TaxID=1314781 RepID=A0A165Q717_EXIGL|nr:hypothetical protein EXIGLDRAFT_828563 [Exidia glandulosa HHB12029]